MQLDIHRGEAVEFTRSDGKVRRGNLVRVNLRDMYGKYNLMAYVRIDDREIPIEYCALRKAIRTKE